MQMPPEEGALLSRRLLWDIRAFGHHRTGIVGRGRKVSASPDDIRKRACQRKANYCATHKSLLISAFAHFVTSGVLGSSVLSMGAPTANSKSANRVSKSAMAWKYARSMSTTVIWLSSRLRKSVRSFS